MTSKIRVFLDTSALFAGIWSASGGARLILRLGESGALQIVLSAQVLEELDTALRQKAPDLRALAALLLDRIQVEITPPAPSQRIHDLLGPIRHPGDARVLADAQGAGVDYFVTLDQEHFLSSPTLAERLPFPMGTPGDFIHWYRQTLVKFRGSEPEPGEPD